MKVTYTGISQELPPKVRAKLDAKFAKLSRLLDSRGEHKAHVIVSQQRHALRVEVTVQFYDHQFVGVGSDADLFTAFSAALAKLETQAVKQRARWRELHRRKENSKRVAAARPEPAETAPAPRVFRVNGADRRKPITLDEALLEIGPDGDYLAYRDARSERLAVLIRRRDGHFDLIES
jgi:putative sigma-54 modulation protein